LFFPELLKIDSRSHALPISQRNRSEQKRSERDAAAFYDHAAHHFKHFATPPATRYPPPARVALPMQQATAVRHVLRPLLPPDPLHRHVPPSPSRGTQ